MSTLKDFNRSFTTMRTLAIVCLLGFIGSTIFYMVHNQRVHEHYQKQTYVITSWGTFPARYYDGRKVSQIEAQNCVEDFVKNMFAHSCRDLSRAHQLRAESHR